MQMKIGNPMHALSLVQPWASLIVRGSKLIETRSWPTNFRGKVAIHASKKCAKGELLHLRCSWNFCGALGLRMGTSEQLWDVLPFGAIVGVATVTECRPTGDFTNAYLDTPRGTSPYQWTERQMGDFRLGRYGFLLSNIREIEPVPCKGMLGFWRVPQEVAAIVEARS
jgi:hypothetical protein